MWRPGENGNAYVDKKNKKEKSKSGDKGKDKDTPFNPKIIEYTDKENYKYHKADLNNPFIHKSLNPDFLNPANNQNNCLACCFQRPSPLKLTDEQKSKAKLDNFKKKNEFNKDVKWGLNNEGRRYITNIDEILSHDKDRNMMKDGASQPQSM